MNLTFHNIANFELKKSNLLFLFFVEFDKVNYNPYGVFLPSTENYFSQLDLLTWLKDLIACKGFHKIPDQFINKHSINSAASEINDETYRLVLRAMFFYMVDEINLSDEVNLNLQWDEFYVNDNSFSPNILHQKFKEFYNQKDYFNYLSFINNFESNIVKYNPTISIIDLIDEVLVFELFMKNIGRNCFSYTQLLWGDSLFNFLDSIVDIDYFPLHPNNLSLSTHFNFTNNTFGNYSITLYFSWSSNQLIKSNIENEIINDNDIINVQLKNILRYSQNYINLLNGKFDFTYSNFIQFYEENIPIIPIDYNFEFFQNKFSSNIKSQKIFTDNSNKEFIFSHKYIDLIGKFNISKSYVDYCSQLFNITNYSDDINKSNAYLQIPFWEISRIQTVLLKKQILANFKDYIEINQKEATVYDENNGNSSYSDNHDNHDNFEDLSYIKQHFKDIYCTDFPEEDNLDVDVFDF